jgi:Fe-S-cluster containining protein
VSADSAAGPAEDRGVRMPPPAPGAATPVMPGINDPAPQTPIEPVQLGLDDTFQFRCRKGIPCFNTCCHNADIMLAPYDIVRLKNRLDVTARAFIDSATTDYAMDAHGMPGLKLATRNDTGACVFLTPEGCGVYEDRPSACRYYALGLLSMRKKDAAREEDTYFVVKEDHCLGHFEDQVQTVRQYRDGQGIDDYDRMNREWRQIVLKKRSAGPAIGSPSPRSLELFFLASYDMDGFRAFVSSAGFRELFDLGPDLESLLADDEKLLGFAYRYLKQALFGEVTIPVKPQAAAQRSERYRSRLAAMAREAAARREAAQDDMYSERDDE